MEQWSPFHQEHSITAGAKYRLQILTDLEGKYSQTIWTKLDFRAAYYDCDAFQYIKGQRFSNNP